jgi:hypothetical protein
MSLSALTYKYIGRFTAPAATVSGNMAAFANAFSSTTYADGTSRVTGSGIAWTPYSQLSGSQTVAVALTPVTSTLGQKIVYAGGATGTPTMISPDTYASTRIIFGLCKNAGSYTSWSDANPFTSGQFSGYTGWFTGTTVNYIHVFESQDSVVTIGETSTGTTYVCCAGAMIDPESSNASASETDGKLYFLCTSGYTAVGQVAHNYTDYTSNQTFLNNINTAGLCHTYVMNIGLATTTTARRSSLFTNALNNLALRNLANEYVRIPIYLVSNASTTATGLFFGRIREFFVFANGQSTTKFQVSGVTSGYLIGTSTAANSETILLKA